MVPIYMEDAATHEHPEGRGVVLWEFDAQGNQRSYRIYPTRNTYEPGQRVGWQWSFDRTWGETFWRDPRDDNRVKLAWSESAEFVGQPLIQQPD